jgi:choice-of-anchor B domain-containing protein
MDQPKIDDVTDKQWPELISVTSYEGATYTHQGWVLDKEWQQYLVVDDEYDEVEGRGPAFDGHAVTYIWDVSDLESPKQTGYYKMPRVGIDHNQYVFGNYAYQSNYGNGISVLDISSIPSNPTGSGVREVGWFDVYPEGKPHRTLSPSLFFFFFFFFLSNPQYPTQSPKKESKHASSLLSRTLWYTDV